MGDSGVYQPGMLSALLLGGATTSLSSERPAAAASRAPAAVVGHAEIDDSEMQVSSAVKKKRNKVKKSAGEGGKPSGKRNSAAVDDDSGGGGATDDSKRGMKGKTPASPFEGLSTLFSPNNLMKFKRRPRDDEEIDELEVARITEQARERERRQADEEANPSTSTKKNKKAKKKEAEELERRRVMEQERREEISQKRTAALKAAVSTARGEGKRVVKEAEAEDEKMEEDEEETEESKGSDSEPESDVAGLAGDSSDEEQEQREENDAQLGEGGAADGDVDDSKQVTLPTRGGMAGAREGEPQGDDEEKGNNKGGNEREGGDGGDDDDKDDRTVFVGNLPTTFNPKKIRRLFKDYGVVESARLRSVAVEGVKVDKAGDQQLVRKVCVNRGMVDGEVKSSVNAYVVFKDAASVEKALGANGTEVEGKHMRVDRARTSDHDHTRSVFLGNLPLNAGEEEVRALFAAKLEGADKAVEGVRLVRDKTTLVGKGFGYVLLADRAHAAAALGVHGTKLRGRPLRVMPCGKRTKGRGGKATPGKEEHGFASFEGRRTTTVEGVRRRLKRKQGTGDVGTQRVGAVATPVPHQPRGPTTASGTAERVGGGAPTLKHKKPRWTNAEGARAGKGGGGRPIERASEVRSPEVGGRGKSPRGGKGRGEAPLWRGGERGGRAAGRGGRGGERGGRAAGRSGRGGERGGRAGGRGGRGGERGRGRGRGRGGR